MKNLKQNKSEKKGGIFGFLNSGANAASGVTPGVIGGTAAQASGGLLSVFAGKIVSTLITVAILGGAGMVYMAGNSGMGGDTPDSELMMASAQEAAEYVPAMQRAEADNEGKSSIAMFNEKNKGAVKFDIDPALDSKNAKGAAAGGDEYDENSMGEYGDPADYMDQAMAGAAESEEGGGLASLNNSNLSTSFGGGDKSSRSLNMGGNKPKLKPTFKSMANMKPLTNFKNNKALAFGKTRKANKISASKVGARGGKGAYSQAKAMNAMLRNATGAKNYSTSRAMTDAAWVGTTGDGDSGTALDAAGLSEGEGMTVGSLGGGNLNGNGYSSYGDGSGNYIPDPNPEVNVTPWESELNAIQALIMSATIVLAAAAIASEIWVIGKALAIAIAAVAAALCLAAAALAVVIMTKYGQTALGGMWLAISGLVGGVCLAAAICGVAAEAKATATVFGIKLPIFLMGISALLGIGTMIGGAYGDKSINDDKAREYCESHPDHDGCSIPTAKAVPFELSDSPVNKTMLS